MIYMYIIDLMDGSVNLLTWMARLVDKHATVYVSLQLWTPLILNTKIMKYDA